MLASIGITRSLWKELCAAHPAVHDSVSLGQGRKSLTCNKFPGGVRAAGPGPHFEKRCPRSIKRNSAKTAEASCFILFIVSLFSNLSFAGDGDCVRFVRRCVPSTENSSTSVRVCREAHHLPTSWTGTARRARCCSLLRMTLGPGRGRGPGSAPC